MQQEQRQEEKTIKQLGREDKKLSQIVKTEDPTTQSTFNSSQTSNSFEKYSPMLSQKNYPDYSRQKEVEYRNYFGHPSFSNVDQSRAVDHLAVLSNMYMTLLNQSNLLAYLVEKNEANLSITTKIYETMQKKKEQQFKNQDTCIPTTKQPSNSGDLTPNDLISIIYGPKTQFKYELILDPDFHLERTLYRQRNFSLKINLLGPDHKPFRNSNKIPISLALYTIENPPHFLQTNTLGNKMIKGHSDQDLIDGICVFEKLQIKQVTSHYRKGMLFLMVFPKMPSYCGLSDVNKVDYTQIRPLVIDKIIVKAKRSKEQALRQQARIKQNEDRLSKQVQSNQERY